MDAKEDDWRLSAPQDHLKGETLYWSQYTQPTAEWDHDHCEFCWAKFMEDDFEEMLHEGYTTADRLSWICKQCFDDFRDRFGWKLVDVQ